MATGQRVKPDDVKDIFETEMSDKSLAKFITTAHIVVQNNIVPKNVLSEEELKQVELYLSAHFASALDPLPRSLEIREEFSEDYQGEWGMGLESTTYGQMALIIDRTHALKALGKKRATFKVHSEYDNATGTL